MLEAELETAAPSQVGNAGVQRGGRAWGEREPPARAQPRVSPQGLAPGPPAPRSGPGALRHAREACPQEWAGSPQAYLEGLSRELTASVPLSWEEVGVSRRPMCGQSLLFPVGLSAPGPCSARLRLLSAHPGPADHHVLERAPRPSTAQTHKYCSRVWGLEALQPEPSSRPCHQRHGCVSSVAAALLSETRGDGAQGSGGRWLLLACPHQGHGMCACAPACGGAVGAELRPWALRKGWLS